MKVTRFFLVLSLLIFGGQLQLHAQGFLISLPQNRTQDLAIYKPSIKERAELEELATIAVSVPVWITSVVSGQENKLVLQLNGVIPDDFSIQTEKTRTDIPFNVKVPNELELIIPALKQDDRILLRHSDDTIAVLFVKVYSEQIQKIRLVPLVETRLQADSIKRFLDRSYQAAGLRFEVEVDPVFKHADLQEKQVFRNPSKAHDRYTTGMRSLRDLYLEQHRDQKNELLVFVVHTFVDPQITGYMVRNKSMGFLRSGNSKKLAIALAEQLEFGLVGMSQEEFTQFKEDAELHLDQWERIRRHQGIYSYYDDYEDLRTNSGIVAYYFWEEDALGNIKLSGKHPLSNLVRPYKKNAFSYHLDIRHFFYKTLFVVKNRTISLVHVVVVLLSFMTMYLIGRRFRNGFRRFFKRPFIWNIGSRLLEWSLALITGYFSLGLADMGYGMYEVKSGVLREFEHFPIQDVQSAIGSKIHPKKIAEPALASEIIVQKRSSYFVRQRKRVLYFSIFLDQEGFVEKMQLVDSKDSLHLPQHRIHKFAQSHYLVFNYRDFSGKLIKEEVYNHVGVNLTDKIALKDPPKRILVFVNGYRPTSLGSSLEDNFKDIQQNGLEFPNSYNRIFTNDQYHYWRPWNAIDAQFSARINPAETYYADGHFSVSTSNYRSLLSFTSTATIYPKRCVSGTKHHCYSVRTMRSKLFGSRMKKTYSLLENRPNKKGFLMRRKHGRVAGRNLLQALNELPNTSRNDTLYLVAHSMGYAYSLGMLDVLRGQIQFGGYYILAPENASSGKVKTGEWKEVWQYGSNFNKIGKEAPCLQDGIAPQVGVGGLPETNRVFIPKRYYDHKGFFDSHFIGYYTWIFELKKEHRGAITQH